MEVFIQNQNFLSDSNMDVELSNTIDEGELNNEIIGLVLKKMDSSILK